MFGLLMKLLVCWILLSSPVWSYGQAPTPGVPTDKPNKQNTDPQKKPETDQRGTDQTPFVVKVLPSHPGEPPPAPPANQEKHQTTYWDWWWDKSPEILIALFTLFLWLATRRLVKGADDTAKKQLRAYVGIESIQVREIDTADPLRGVVTLANFGQTMAKDLEFWITGAVEVITRQEFPWGDRKLRTVAMPGERVMFEEPITFGKHDLTLMDQGAGNALLWGKITYTDVFGKNHWTIFRFVTYEREGNGWKTRTSQEGNNAGEGEPPLPLRS